MSLPLEVIRRVVSVRGLHDGSSEITFECGHTQYSRYPKEELIHMTLCCVACSRPLWFKDYQARKEAGLLENGAAQQ